MKLTSLDIRLNLYGENEGKYTGTISYQAQRGSTTLTLDAEISAKIMGFMGPVITAAATKVAKQLEADLQQSLTEVNAPQIADIAS